MSEVLIKMDNAEMIELSDIVPMEWNITPDGRG